MIPREKRQELADETIEAGPALKASDGCVTISSLLEELDILEATAHRCLKRDDVTRDTALGMLMAETILRHAIQQAEDAGDGAPEREPDVSIRISAPDSVDADRLEEDCVTEVLEVLEGHGLVKDFEIEGHHPPGDLP